MSIDNLDIERRNRIINASLKEFAIKGFEKASTNVIAKEAGISKALMFHYVGSKQELYFFVYNYSMDLIKNEYRLCLDLNETDVFERLYQSCVLQLGILKKHPSLLLFIEVNQKQSEQDFLCMKELLKDVNESKLKDGISIEEHSQYIFWIVAGFINEIVDEIKSNEMDTTKIELKLVEHFNQCKRIFYK